MASAPSSLDDCGMPAASRRKGYWWDVWVPTRLSWQRPREGTAFAKSQGTQKAEEGFVPFSSLGGHHSAGWFLTNTEGP